MYNKTKKIEETFAPFCICFILLLLFCSNNFLVMQKEQDSELGESGRKISYTFEKEICPNGRYLENRKRWSETFHKNVFILVELLMFHFTFPCYRFLFCLDRILCLLIEICL